MIKNKLFRSFLFTFIVVLYFFSRLQNLISIPVFGDEAIYIRWAQIIKSEETLRFIPQTDGKQPLFMWLNAVSLKFIENPLIAGRFISIISGFGIVLMLFFTTAIILNFNSSEKDILKFIKKSISTYFYSALFTSLIYCLLPFTFFFDRLALADTLLSFFGLTSLLFSLLLSKYPRLDLSLILGAILGLAWLTKSPAIYFIALSIGTFIVLKKKTTIYDLTSTIYLPLISSFIAFIIYNILRLGPQFNMIYLRNRDYVWSFAEIIKHPFDPLRPHLLDTFTLYSHYISWSLLLTSLLGILFYFYQKNKFKQTFLVLISWWLLPLIANAAIAKVFTARYILFTLPSLIIIFSLSIGLLK
jgi:4-amino-4-deoxy-L-arabinose transferase-like glycosyltransferase